MRSTVKQGPGNVEYVVVLNNDTSSRGYRPFGTVRDFWFYQGNEVMLAGPYETGKTYGALQKLHNLLLKYDGAQAIMVRKSYSSLKKSALQTYYKKVLPKPPGHLECPVTVYGGGNPEVVYYPNMSELHLGGMDYPDKVLSSEWDFIFVPQAEELLHDEWMALMTRCTGRAGNVPYPQFIGDCNPDIPTHWIINRPTLNVLHTKHTDNPTLYVWEKYRKDNGRWTWQLAHDDNGEPILTMQGKRTMSALDSLEGVRYKRGRLGLWVGAEGQVYESFDPEVHIFDPHKFGWVDGRPPNHWRKYVAIDFGYRHPFVAQWWAEDEDGRLYMYREIFFSERTVQEHVTGEKSTFGGMRFHSQGEYYREVICDWDAEDRATLENLTGWDTVNADKRKKVGFDLVIERLKVQADGRPRIMFSRDALVEPDEQLRDRYAPIRTTDEFASYVWRALPQGKEMSSRDEEPVKKHDDGMDTMRYMVAYLDGDADNSGAGVVRYI